MGGCLSRKKDSPPLNASVPVSIPAPEKLIDCANEEKLKNKVFEEEKGKKEAAAAEESLVKKEIFVIKHRKSHDRERPSLPPPQKQVPLVEENKVTAAVSASPSISSDMVVRTSSCTKEEVDAILIQCGRLSRSNSSGAGKAASSGRKYSGSKRSYDLDQEQDLDRFAGNEEEDEIGTNRQHRQRHRQSGRASPSSSSQGKRRTPSREREQRSGSKERANGSGRRISRSPGRRSETNSTPVSNNSTNRPGKMVSVPPTVSLTMEKNNNGVESQTGAGIKKISVKRNVGETGSKTAASPRSQSPARNDNQQQQSSLSRSSSRKAELSPYRRNPLSEINPNSLVYTQSSGNNKINKPKNREPDAQFLAKEVLNQGQMQRPNVEAVTNKIMKEQTVIVEEAKAQTHRRSRSARRSRDLDFNPETLLNPNPSYTALLLEDIQNFHQKNTNTNTSTDGSSFSVPACVAKANSILEAVADLNSTTSSNISCKKVTDVKEPFVESEVGVSDDIMEPSLHKYVTIRRGGNGEDMDGQESSGSNSFVVGSQHQWGYSTSSREPNSVDSTDRWTSRSNAREDDERSPLEEARRGFSGQRTGIARGRAGFSKNLHSTPVVATAST